MEEIIKSNRNRTGYMGVREEKEMKEGTRKWRAIASINGKKKSIGFFYTAIEAAKAYSSFIKLNDSSVYRLKSYKPRKITKRRKDNTSGFRGVSKFPYKCLDGRIWRAQISDVSNGTRKMIQLGRYSTKKEAALAYNKKAIELFGELALLNVIS